MKRLMLSCPRTILNGALAFTSLLPLALASLTINLEIGRSTTHETTKTRLNVAIVGIRKLAHGHTAHKFGNARDEPFLVKPKVFERVCEPFLELANTVFDCAERLRQKIQQSKGEIMRNRLNAPSMSRFWSSCCFSSGVYLRDVSGMYIFTSFDDQNRDEQAQG